MIEDGIRLAADGEDLTSDIANAVMEDMMSGAATPPQMASFLTAMRTKGETKAELLGFVRCMRSRMETVVAPEGAVDLCGTGGDSLNTFNISTAASFVVSAAGAPVAKHGNRAVSSKSGSADILSAMGIPIGLGREDVASCIKDTGIGFMFAPEFHPSMKNVMPTRRKLGIRTFFNILGPMVNPASVRRQLIGVYDPSVAPIMAEVLCELGTEHAMIVNGGGMDEMTNIGPTAVVELRNGSAERYEVTPDMFGLDIAEPEDIAGGSAIDNARKVLRILEGEASPRSDIVVLNAAAALYVAGKASDVHEGMKIARGTIREGRARAKLVEFHDRCTQLESEAQLRSETALLSGRRAMPEVLRTRCAQMSAGLLTQTMSLEGGPSHVRRLDPDIMAHPTVLTVLTMNRLLRVLTNSDASSTSQEGRHGRLSKAIAESSGIAVIGEYKPRSPSTSKFFVPPAPAETAEAYSASGVTAMSVLAEEDYFGGGTDLFREMRSLVDMPMLFKDFVISERQVETAFRAGADAILLIAKSLSKEGLDDLVQSALRTGVEPLVEVHDGADLQKVASCASYGQIEMIGINGRDLQTLNVDLKRARDLRKSVDEDKIVIAESGVRSEGDVLSLGGFDGVLIGSMFMQSSELRKTVQQTVMNARGVKR